MIDRIARDQLADALRSYMDERLTAFEFDERLTSITDKTKDSIAQLIARSLWFYYDDWDDRRIVASKEDWDFFNRLLLLLASDAELHMSGSRRWRVSQAVAAVSLACFAILTTRSDFALWLIPAWCTMGPVSMALAWFNNRRETLPRDDALTPFPSVSNLLAVRRSVPRFSKAKYPKAIAGRRIRDPISSFLTGIPAYVM